MSASKLIFWITICQVKRPVVQVKPLQRSYCSTRWKTTVIWTQLDRSSMRLPLECYCWKAGGEGEISTVMQRRGHHFLSSRCFWNENGGIGSTRRISCFTVTVFQSNSGGSDKDKPEDEKDSNKSNSGTVLQTDQHNSPKVHNPKEDGFFTQDVAYGTKENKGLGEPERPVFVPGEKEPEAESEDLTPPTNCCQSGCPNCVWIEYVEKLSKKLTDPNMTRARILEELNGLEDENIKAFIMMELRVKKLI